MKKCPKCGSKIKTDSAFCENCGSKLSVGKYLKQSEKRKSKKKGLKTISLSVILLASLLCIISLLTKGNNEYIPELSEEDIDKIYKHYETVSNKISTVASEFEDSDGFVNSNEVELVLESISHYAEELLNEGEITDYHYQKGDSCVYMEIDRWLGIIYDPSVRDTLSGDDVIQIVTLEPYASELDTFGSYVLSGAQGPDEGAKLIEENVEGFSFTSNLDDKEITIETIRELPAHSVIVWTGHGSFTNELGPMLCLCKVYGSEELIQYQKEISSKAICLSTSGEIRITSKFFEQFIEKDKLKGSLVYFNTCFSFTDERLADSILDLGAIAYIGNSTVTNCMYAFNMVYGFLEGLTPISTGFYYRPIQEALSYAKLKHGATDWAMGGEVKLKCQYDIALPEMM